MKAQVLILPGLHNSGPAHWQTLWEKAHPDFKRVEEKDWERPHCADWVAALETAVVETGPQVVLVAHSLACTQVIQWSKTTRRAVRGALLVAPSDVEGAHYPPEPQGFAPVPMKALPFPSLVVASTNDPFMTFTRAKVYASAWGSKLISVGALGHINAESGIGGWPEGIALLEKLRG